MSQSTISEPKATQELESIIQKAIKKVGGKKENDLCKYIPADGGGYLHHFTLRKMKNESPTELASLIQKFINKIEKPLRVAPKPRAARGSRTRGAGVALTRPMLERMLNVARLVGDKEMIGILDLFIKESKLMQRQCIDENILFFDTGKSFESSLQNAYEHIRRVI